jgi:hypothetical protein
MALQVQKTVFDLETFEEVTLVKEFEFSPVTSIEDALSRLGNDGEKLLKVLNDGLIDETRNRVREDNDGWHTFDEEKEGEINGAFTGKIADQKSVNNLVLTLAKTVFGFTKDMSKDQKRAAKSSAMEMIKSNESIKAGLQKSAVRK